MKRMISGCLAVAVTAVLAATALSAQCTQCSLIVSTFPHYNPSSGTISSSMSCSLEVGEDHCTVAGVITWSPTTNGNGTQAGGTCGNYDWHCAAGNAASISWMNIGPVQTSYTNCTAPTVQSHSYSQVFYCAGSPGPDVVFVGRIRENTSCTDLNYGFEHWKCIQP